MEREKKCCSRLFEGLEGQDSISLNHLKPKEKDSGKPRFCGVNGRDCRKVSRLGHLETCR